jgi:hypothetical protein
MTAPRVWKRGFVTTAAVLVVVLGAGVAHADVVFRKKVPAATDDTGLEGSPSGSADGTAPTEGTSTTPSASQADDKDFPEAQSQREKARADAALARQLKNAELAKEKEGPPIYKKWQFWAVAGAILVGGIALIWGGSAIVHEVNGGDIKGCSAMNSPAGCFGEGR